MRALLQINFFLATHNPKVMPIEEMISISAKLCTKPIAHSKSCITHILFVTMLSLVREAVRVESSGSSAETLISVPQVCEKQQVKP